MLDICYTHDSHRFQSTRPVRGATMEIRQYSSPRIRFNPRAPCGARPGHRRRAVNRQTFQSTRPVRGATESHINIDSQTFVSIHAPRAGRDSKGIYICTMAAVCFNPRAPCGARLQLVHKHPGGHSVSIHAPRAGRDPGPADVSATFLVSIHAPRAGRDQLIKCHCFFLSKFQSTRPVRGATRSSARVSSLPTSFNPRAPCGARQFKSNFLCRQ